MAQQTWSTYALSDAQKVKQKADNEVVDTQSVVNQSKDQAQTAASIAMSIMSVALLKIILDQGPANNKYYYPELALICLALGLQIMTGVMAIAIANLVRYTSKHGESPCDDCQEHCCCWSCVLDRGRNRHGSGRIRPLYSGETFDSLPSQVKVAPDGTLALEPVGPDWPWDYGVLATESGQNGCPCRCVSQVYDEDERRALNMFHHWLHGHLDREMLATKATETADQQTKLLESLQSEIEALNSDNKDAMAELQEKKTRAHAQKSEAEEVTRKAEIARDQGRLLEGAAKAVRRKRVMKTMSYWQNIMGYLFYVILIINIVITGFGLSGNISC